MSDVDRTTGDVPVVVDPDGWDIEGQQRGPHAPKVGCWGCVEAFVSEVDHVMVDDSGMCHHPENGRVKAAFRAWAEDLQLQHG